MLNHTATKRYRSPRRRSAAPTTGPIPSKMLSLGLLLAAFALAGCGGLSTPVPSPGGPWYADPGGDDAADCLSPASACATIQAAIGKADPGGTVIAAAGTYSESLNVNKALVLQGAGIGSTVLDGGGSQRVVYVSPAIVEISDLTIQNGWDASLGAGIANSGELALTNVSIENNISTEGGGVYNAHGLDMTNVSFSGNSADRGGGLYNFSPQPVTATGLTMTFNNAAVAGGAIYNRGDLSLTDALIENSIADGDGGGIFNHENAVISLTDSTLNLNFANGGYDGGGFYNRGGLTIVNSNITNNYAAADGGGGWSAWYQATLQLTDTTISGNMADGRGGGLLNGQTVTMTGGELSQNQAEFGGGMFSWGDAVLTNVVVDDNEATEGGGFGNSNSRLELVNVDLTNNRATTMSCCSAGGGIHANGPDSLVLVTNSLVDGNEATTSVGALKGGGIYSRAGQVIIAGSSISNNIAPRGGGVSIDAGVLEIHNSTVENNHAFLAGGGIYLHPFQYAASNDFVWIRSSVISGNTSDDDGGGLYGDMSNWSSNQPVVFRMDDTTVSGNMASGNGGGLNLDQGDITRVTISGNTALGSGGGLFTHSLDLLELSNTTISGNFSDNGAGVLVFQGAAQLTYTTFGNNQGVNYGPSNGALKEVSILAPSQVQALASVLSDNNGPNCAGAIISIGANYTSDTSCPFNLASDQKQMGDVLEPLANNGGPTETHALLTGSAPINMDICHGYNEDQRQAPRPAFTLCDSGAYEVQGQFVFNPAEQFVCLDALRLSNVRFQSVSLRETEGVLVVLDVPGGLPEIPDERAPNEAWMGEMSNRDYACQPDANFPGRLFCTGPDVPGDGEYVFRLFSIGCPEPEYQQPIRVPTRPLPLPTATPTPRISPQPPATSTPTPIPPPR